MKNRDKNKRLDPPHRRQQGFIEFSAGDEAAPERSPWSRQMQALFEQSGRIAAVDKSAHVVRLGDGFRDIHGVRNGSFKAYTNDTEGREHVLGFFFPGDIIGFDAIHTGRYRANFMALEPSEIYVIPFEAVDSRFSNSPQLFMEILAMLSQNILRSEVMAGDYTAEERVSAFLVSLSYRLNNGSAYVPDLHLPMSRREIANHLRLAPETVSRTLDGLSRQCMIKAHGQVITIVDRPGLIDVGGNMVIP